MGAGRISGQDSQRAGCTEASLRAAFALAFARSAQHVRLRRAGQQALYGALVGSVAAGLLSLCAWLLQWHGPRWTLCIPPVVGMLAGAAHSHLVSWKDERIALFLDRVLQSDESIATAIELSHPQNKRSQALAAVLQRAQQHLEKHPKPAWPSIWQRRHWLLLPAWACALVFALVPLPPAAATPSPDPGSDVLRRNHLAGLDETAALSQNHRADRAERTRLRRLAKEAQQLRRDLKTGIPRREAQARLNRLRQNLQKERQQLGTGKEKAGMQAALEHLAASPALAKAGLALARGDQEQLQQQLDAAAQKSTAHEQAKWAQRLAQAAQRAHQQGARRVGQALQEQAERMQGQALRTSQARQLEQALASVQENAQSQAASRQQLAQRVAQLSPRERQRLIEQIGRQQAGSELQQQAQRSLQRSLASAQGRRQLFRELANPSAEPAASVRHEQQLKAAERALAQGQRQLYPGSPSGPRDPRAESPTPATEPQSRNQQGHRPSKQAAAPSLASAAGQRGHANSPPRSGQASENQASGKPGSARVASASATHRNTASTNGGSASGGGPKTAHQSAPIDGTKTLQLRVARRVPGSDTTSLPFGTGQGQAQPVAPAAGPSRSAPGAATQPQRQGVHANPVPAEYREQVRRYFNESRNGTTR